MSSCRPSSFRTRQLPGGSRTNGTDPDESGGQRKGRHAFRRKFSIATSNRIFDEAFFAIPRREGRALCPYRGERHGERDGRRNNFSIYEPFFTTKEKGKGTGLGLSTVYGIVKQSAGYITCHSERERGTTFTIYLPLTLEEANEPQLPSQGTAASRGTETLLLVDDDFAVRNVMKIALEKTGYIVKEASGGEEALSEVEAGDSSFALLVADVVLPRMNGK